MPAGVAGTGPGIISARRPMFTGCMPSTSLSGSMASSAASKSMCGGVGCWMRKPSTSGSSLNAFTAASTSACVAVSGRCWCGADQPSSRAFSIFMPT